MKNYSLRLIVAASLLLAGATCVQAQYAPSRYQYAPYIYGQFYLNGDVGGSLMQNMTVKNGGGSGLSFDPGTRADVTFGYQIINPLAVEFEVGALWNAVNSVNGVNLGGFGQRADLYQVPFLANLVGRIPLAGGFSVYAGVGAGGVATALDLSEDQGHDFRQRSSDTDCTFAYQAMAGVKYALAPNMEVGVGYKFLGTLDHSWFNGDPNLAIGTGPAYSHSILASFTARF